MKRIFLGLIFSMSLSMVTVSYAAIRHHPQTSTSKIHTSYNNLSLEALDGNFTAQLNGYALYDWLGFTNDRNTLTSGTYFRRAELDLNGTIAKDWGYLIAYDFANSLYKSVYLSYNGWKSFSVLAGQFSPAFGLSNSDDLTAINFLELSLPVNAISTPYTQGASVGWNDDHWVVVGAAFQPGTGTTVVGSKPLGETLRVVFVPMHTPIDVLHFGLSGWHQNSDGSNSVDFSTVPEANSYRNETLIDTGSILNTSYYNAIDGEFAWVKNAFTVNSEYVKTWVQRKPGFSNVNFNGYYLTLAYFLTGESSNYTYPGAYFTTLKDIKGKYGAWQIATRFSSLNLNDGIVRGGKENDFTVGLNWYPSKLGRIMFNYIRAMAHPAATGQDINANIYAIRAQVNF